MFIDIAKMCLTGLILLISERQDQADSLARIMILIHLSKPRRPDS
jgi:hypothetical protein